MRVQVQVISPRAAERRRPGRAAVPAPSSRARPSTLVASRPDNATPRSDSGGSRPTIGVNQPVELEPEPESATKPPSPGGPALAVENGEPRWCQRLACNPANVNTSAAACSIYVPRSFYLQRGHQDR